MKASEAGDLLTRTGDSITIIANEAVDGSATSFDGSSGITALNLLTTRTGAGITATLNATKDELTNDDGDATTLTTDSDDTITINISTESGNVFDFGDSNDVSVYESIRQSSKSTAIITAEVTGTKTDLTAFTDASSATDVVTVSITGDRYTSDDYEQLTSLLGKTDGPVDGSVFATSAELVSITNLDGEDIDIEVSNTLTTDAQLAQLRAIKSSTAGVITASVEAAFDKLKSGAKDAQNNDIALNTQGGDNGNDLITIEITGDHIDSNDIDDFETLLGQTDAAVTADVRLLSRAFNSFVEGRLLPPVIKFH